MNGDFAVSQSMLAMEQLDEILSVLRGRGETALAASSVRWILEELTRTPMEFGESRFHLEFLDLFVRVGFSGPICVNYSVNPASHQVFIRRWGLKKHRIV